jgi:hypothetical protein
MSDSTKGAPKSKLAPVKSYLKQYAALRPEGSLPIYKFVTESDAIVAKLMARRAVINAFGKGSVLDVDIIENANGAELGPHSVFESKGIRQIFDQHQPNVGDIFILKFDSVADTGFKKFAFKIIERATDNQNGKQDDIPF